MKTEIEERAERKKLLDKYDKATDKEKVEILWSALGYMQQYNGISYYDAIVRGMGGQVFYVSGGYDG
jgi:hypothetical protein